jgi:hypothetical protein
VRLPRGAALLLALVLAATGLSGCGGDDDPASAYCDVVAAKQQELTDILSTGAPDVLIRALGIFRALRDKAPGDVSDEWQQVVRSIEALDKALDDAGVDPATYDRKNPPAGLTQAERARIDAAARELGSKTTSDAFEGIKQEVKDVCHTALYL